MLRIVSAVREQVALDTHIHYTRAWQAADDARHTQA